MLCADLKINSSKKKNNKKIVSKLALSTVSTWKQKSKVSVQIKVPFTKYLHRINTWHFCAKPYLKSPKKWMCARKESNRVAAILVVDEEIPPYYVKCFECLEKRYINVTNYYYYYYMCRLYGTHAPIKKDTKETRERFESIRSRLLCSLQLSWMSHNNLPAQYKKTKPGYVRQYRNPG